MSRTARMATLPRAARLALRVVVVAGASIALAPSASAETGTQGLATSAEAWHTITAAPDPVAEICVLVGQCPQEAAAPDPNPYPPDTLHVDVDGGHERARTYLAFDLGELPEGAVVDGGTLRLPVAEVAAGTLGAAEAKLQLCVVRTPFEEVEGSLAEPPAPDCGTPAPITIEDQEGVLTAVADLASLAPEWESETRAAVAVMPTAQAIEAQETWHVAFHGRRRQAEGAVPITASFDYTVTEDDAPGDEPFDDPEPFDPGTSLHFPDLGSSVDIADHPAPAVDQGAPVVAQDAVAGGEVVVRRFAYPLIFLLPILLLSGTWYFAGAFTATPVPLARSGRTQVG